MTELTRRTAATGVAARPPPLAPLAAASPARAAAPPAGTQAPGFYRYKVGNFEITVVTDGVNRIQAARQLRRECQEGRGQCRARRRLHGKGRFRRPVQSDRRQHRSEARAHRHRHRRGGLPVQQGLERPVPDQSGGRRHRSQGDRCRHHLALSTATTSTACSRPTTRSPFRMPRFWCRPASTSSGWTTAR